jgi:hypothetical protein
MALESTLTINEAAREILPPQDHADVGREVFGILEEILRYKAEQGLPAKWMRAYELTKGRHWKKETAKVPLVTANLILTHRQRTVSMLTDNSPTFNARQSGEVPPEQAQKVDLLKHTAAHWWEDTEQQDALETSVIAGETNGWCGEKIRFNPDAEYGVGEVETVEVDPFHFGWYPTDCKDPQQADANLHFWPMPIREARRRWPKMAAQILADEDLLAQLGDGREQVLSPIARERDNWFVSMLAGLSKMFTNTASDMRGRSDKVLVVECWVKDYTRKKNDDGTEQDLYPGNIRCVWVCNGGQLVLQDSPNPSINWDLLPVEQASKTFLFDKFPFNTCVSYKDLKSPWGMTDVEQLESLNIEINKTLAQMTALKDKVAKVVTINPANSGVSNREFTNNPSGVINPKNHLVSTAIRHLDAPQVSPEIRGMLETYRELFFLISGSFDLEQADAPGNNAIAYKAIAALLERVATLLRSKLRNYHRLIRNRGRMYLSCAMNWYVDDRWVVYEEDDEEILAQVTGQQLIIPAKLSVVSGSTMPVSKIQQREEALELARMGMIDNEELLKKLEWDDRKSVISRMKQGPVGIAIERLVALGLPEFEQQYMTEIGVMDDKEFKRRLEQGELRPIQVAPEAAPAPQESPVDTAEAELKTAQAEKARTETALIEEKIVTEKVQQQVMLSGVEFDREKLTIERARTVSDIQSRAKQEMRADVESAHSLSKTDRDEYREDEGRAIEDAKAQDEQKRADRSEKREDAQAKAEQKRADHAEKREDKKVDAEIKTAAAKQKVQGPYRESGLKSNNKK